MSSTSTTQKSTDTSTKHYPKVDIHSMAKKQSDEGEIGTFVKNPYVLLEIIENRVPTLEFSEHGIAELHLRGKELELVTSGVAPRSLLTEDTLIHKEHRGEMGTYLDRTKVELEKPVSAKCIIYTKQAILDDYDSNYEKACNEGRDEEELLQMRDDRKEFAQQGYDYTWVVTLADPRPVVHLLESNIGDTPEDPKRFLHNLCGGNIKYDSISADILELAEEYHYQVKSVSFPENLDITETTAWEFCKRLSEYSDKENNNDKEVIAKAKDILSYWSEWVVLA